MYLLAYLPNTSTSRPYNHLFSIAQSIIFNTTRYLVVQLQYLH
jgi:hypothetical protein